MEKKKQKQKKKTKTKDVMQYHGIFFKLYSFDTNCASARKSLLYQKVEHADNS